MKLSAQSSARTGATQTRSLLLPLSGSSRPRTLSLPTRRVQQYRAATFDTAQTADEAPASAAKHDPGAIEEAFVQPGSFSWTDHWYPVAPVSYLDPDRPNAVTLMGKPYAVWRDDTGSWRAFDDACPHRLSPLSDGVLSSDRSKLVCVYHGWRFDAQGEPTDIPQQAPESGGPRPCASSHPVREAQGLLWLFPRGGPEGFTAAAQNPPAIVEDLDSPDWYKNGDWVVSNFANSIEAWLEQGFDPSHAPHLHNGEFGFSYKSAVPMDMRLKGKVEPQGFSVTHGAYTARQEGMEAVREFRSPCTNRVEYTYKDGKKDLFVIHYTPVSKYEVRILFAGASNRPPPAALKLMGSLPPGIAHALPNIGDQDALIIAAQERLMQGQGMSWRKYRLASPADTGVGAVRNWLSRVAGPIPYAGGASACDAADKARALDRWERHTKHCPKCQQAVRRIDAAAAALQVATIVLLVVGAALRSGSLTQLACSPPILAAGVAAAAAAVLRSFRTRYFSVGYVSWQKRQWEGGNKLLGIGEGVFVVGVGLVSALLKKVGLLKGSDVVLRA